MYDIWSLGVILYIMVRELYGVLAWLVILYSVIYTRVLTVLPILIELSSHDNSMYPLYLLKCEFTQSYYKQATTPSMNSEHHWQCMAREHPFEGNYGASTN